MDFIKTDYATLKQFCQDRDLSPQTISMEGSLTLVRAADDYFALEALIEAANLTDLEANFITNVPIKKLSPEAKNPIVSLQDLEGDFNTYVSHNLCDNTTWSATNNSLWALAPTAGNVMYLKKAEVQFTHDVKLKDVTTLYFDTYAYNPLDLPNKVLVDRVSYASLKNVFERGNEHFHAPGFASAGELTSGLTTVQFNYPRSLPLKSSQGVEVRLSTEGHTEVIGEYCTVAFTCMEEVE